MAAELLDRGDLKREEKYLSKIFDAAMLCWQIKLPPCNMEPCHFESEILGSSEIFFVDTNMNRSSCQQM